LTETATLSGAVLTRRLKSSGIVASGETLSVFNVHSVRYMPE
jgi:hypothetical protein